MAVVFATQQRNICGEEYRLTLQPDISVLVSWLGIPYDSTQDRHTWIPVWAQEVSIEFSGISFFASPLTSIVSTGWFRPRSRVAMEPCLRQLSRSRLENFNEPADKLHFLRLNQRVIGNTNVGTSRPTRLPTAVQFRDATTQSARMSSVGVDTVVTRESLAKTGV